MTVLTTFGIGGYCKDCDHTHDHPLHNIVEIREITDEETGEPLDTTD